MMEEEFSHSRQDARGEKGPNEESEESKHLIPQKHQNTTNSPFTFSTTTKHHEMLAKRVIVVAHTDAGAI